MDSVSDVEQVSSTADELIQAIALPIAFGDAEFGVSATIGIAVYPDHGTTADTLRQRADAAMYAAKDLGKNRFHFAEPLKQQETLHTD